jgi:hypothetical protein
MIKFITKFKSHIIAWHDTNKAASQGTRINNNTRSIPSARYRPNLLLTQYNIIIQILDTTTTIIIVSDGCRGIFSDSLSNGWSRPSRYPHSEQLPSVASSITVTKIATKTWKWDQNDKTESVTCELKQLYNIFRHEFDVRITEVTISISMVWSSSDIAVWKYSKSRHITQTKYKILPRGCRLTRE